MAMASASKKRTAKRPAKGKRPAGAPSAFRSEFYREEPDAQKRAAAARALNRGRTRRKRVPLAITLGCFALLLCIIAVGGSSAMIWLRKLGAVFGVYWEGDF